MYRDLIFHRSLMFYTGLVGKPLTTLVPGYLFKTVLIVKNHEKNLVSL